MKIRWIIGIILAVLLSFGGFMLKDLYNLPVLGRYIMFLGWILSGLIVVLIALKNLK